MEEEGSGIMEGGQEVGVSDQALSFLNPGLCSTYCPWMTFSGLEYNCLTGTKSTSALSSLRSAGYWLQLAEV